MKLWSLALIAPVVSATCAGDQLRLVFLRLNPDPQGGPLETHEVCPAAGSCVNMQSGPDGWSQKVGQVTMDGRTCVRFFKSYGCPAGQEVWQPGCPDSNWGEKVPLNWQHGAMKSYTVWRR
ncbi:hypothetical protein NM208_g8313 [Fusarium decemcellulare]|uniref:Uncharacterized protein n=1 Tax=Fusarium decemcellulare TaxID=57161 RepID=A0ACC1S6D3_9HYPO|nr:hypothetical protein NM208_g8313 [Fusarium decemcellulare]